MVAPFARAWIETVAYVEFCPDCSVAPFARAWIETCCISLRSALSPVAPFARAWIETSSGGGITSSCCVAPFARAWIETHKLISRTLRDMSHPLRVRGLKLADCLLHTLTPCRTLCACVD